MEMKELIIMLAEGSRDTFYMTVISTLCAYILGFPIGVALVVTPKNALVPSPVINKIINSVVNITRSVPFLILMIAILPLAKLLVGKSYGPAATSVALVCAATPFVARMIESSLLEVDAGVIEAAESMGASPMQIILRVLLPEAKTSLITGATISLGTILGYSAMAGVIGGGGLGDIAIRYGFYRYQTDIMLITVVLLIVYMQILQKTGTKLARVTDKRIRG